MRRIAKPAVLAVLFVGLLVIASPASSEEEACGIVHQQRREPLEGQRFWPLAEHGGRAVLDKKTCLVASTDIWTEPVTLSEAMARCATLGQGGPYGEMGWQLPTMAELTSLDGESQGADLPSTKRSETPYWTITEWPGSDNSYATVMFSGRTTIVVPAPATEKAGVWCVQGLRATGLK
ncbi:Lcl domain-containing protein [Taklimakanibacter deserti]|uniref:Lcl domain-containing protein n=1 Tax=Taklimakanibacter deserti TaxID=2267839 RepID=UPI000E64C9CB